MQKLRLIKEPLETSVSKISTVAQKRVSQRQAQGLRPKVTTQQRSKDLEGTGFTFDSSPQVRRVGGSVCR